MIIISSFSFKDPPAPRSHEGRDIQLMSLLIPLLQSYCLRLRCAIPCLSPFVFCLVTGIRICNEDYYLSFFVSLCCNVMSFHHLLERLQLILMEESSYSRVKGDGSSVRSWMLRLLREILILIDSQWNMNIRRKRERDHILIVKSLM